MKFRDIAVAMVLLSSGCQDPYAVFEGSPSNFATLRCSARSYDALNRAAQNYAHRNNLSFRARVDSLDGSVFIITMVGDRSYFVLNRAAGELQLAQYQKTGLPHLQSDTEQFERLSREIDVC